MRPLSFVRPLSLLAVAFLAVSTPACKGKDKSGGDGTTPGGDSVTTGGENGTRAGGGDRVARPLSAETLNPVIREFGADGVVPGKIIVEFSSNVVDGQQINRATEKTVLDIVPETPGTLTFTGPSTLTFVPKRPLEYATTYVVTLKAVETREGVIAVPADGSLARQFTRQFTTPAFAFLRMSPSEIDLKKDRVGMNVVFSGPVTPAAAKSFLSWSIDGTSTDVKLSSTEDPNVLRATIASARVKPLADIRLQLKVGLASSAGAGTAKAKAAEASFEIAAGKPIQVKNAVLKEGATGHYVDVICSDEAAGDQNRYYWDNEQEDSYYVSKRCQLTEEDAASAIHFTPPVDFYVSGGQAGFRVFGDFKRGSYSMRIDAGAGSVDGGVLQATYEDAFSVPARKPQVSFTSSGRYLPRAAWKNLAINHLNVDKVELTVRHVPPENLVFWLSDDYSERADERTSNLVLTKSIAVKGEPDTMATSWVDVGSMLPASTRGVLELTVSSDSARASSRLLLTDMSLVAKKSLPPPGERWKHEVFVWALDMDSSNLLSGAEISLVRKSGKTVAKCTTSGDDGCVLKVGANDAGDADTSEPFALIAKKGDDLTYIRYADLKTEISDSNVQGEPYLSDKVYRASVWSDRGVYRPGDIAHLAAIVRTRADVAPEAGLPVEVKILDPREKVSKKLTLKTNEAGLIALDLPFAAFADTGRWKVDLTVAEKPVGEYGFNVEEFVPERMKVEAKATKPGYAISDVVPVQVEAKYLFGGTAEGNPVELTCQLEPSTFKPKDNANFTYGVWRQNEKEQKTLTLGQVRGELDDKGHAVLECPPLAAAGGFQGAGRLVANVSVFEAGSGRSTLGQAYVPVHPETYYLGLSSGTKKVGAGKAFGVSGVVVDWNGALAPSAVKEVQVEFIRLESEYGYFWDEDEGSERYQRWLRPVAEGKKTVPVVDGKFTVEATPTSASAGFVVRVKHGSAQTDLNLEGENAGGYYWSYSENRVDQTPRPLKPTSIAIEMPRAMKVGESATVKFKAPYKGKVLLTAETDRVIASEWKKVEAGDASWAFKVKSFAPNVYVSAFLVKDPHLESKESFLPDRAFGVGSSPVTPVEFTQTVALKVPDEVRSNATLTVELDLGKLDGATYATVAAVDEGILSLTKFKSPDPFESIFAKRALGVETFETVGWTMLLPPAGNSRSTGGDGEGALEAGRVQPVKPVALWSGVVKVPEDGKTTISFEVPQYRGKLRVMAVTASPKKMGRASAEVLVRDPLVVQTTLPRFLSQGDEIQIPVFVTNLSGAPQDVKVTLTAENLPVAGVDPFGAGAANPIRFLGKPEGTVRLADGKAGTVVFQAKAVMAVGAAKFRVTVSGGGHTSKEELDVPFLPSGPKERIVQRLELAEGTTDLAPLLDGWVPTSEKTTLWVTGNPYGESFNHLSYLIRYPYGCIEQTTSSTRPLLFVGNLVESVDPTLVANGKIDDMVMAGVNRLLSMQTPSGGFGYWMGDTQPTPWGSAYATHVLIDAQKLGYAVPQDRLDDVYRWMETEVARYEKGGGSERGDHGWDTSAEAYMHYDLALAGKGKKARIQKLIEASVAAPVRKYQSKGAKAEEEYMLKAALWLAGDHRYEKDLKNPDVSPIREERENSWSFYSDRRRRAFMLSTFQDLFGNDPAGQVLADRVAEGLKGNSSQYNTQELVWGVTGLGKRVKDAPASFKLGGVMANGKAIAEKPPKAGAKGGSDKTYALARASEYESLKLEVKEKGQGALYLIANSEGVREKADWKVGGEGLKLDRVYRTLDGTRIDPAAGMSLAELAFVEITITNTSGERVQNIALVDRLPAGWEIENPRLGRGTPVEWLDLEQTWTADFMNVRDDRIEVFGKLETGETKKVVYGVRAVTSGKFTIPPVEAEAMYDPKIWARDAGRPIEIRGPWADFLL